MPDDRQTKTAERPGGDRVRCREAERKILEVALRLYPSRAQRASMRGALMGAAALLDALAVDIAAQHKVRGRVTKDGQRLAAMVTDCASTILSMREKIEVPHG